MKKDVVIMVLAIAAIIVIGFFTLKYLKETNAAIKASKV
jgi:hypothetical protein